MLLLLLLVLGSNSCSCSLSSKLDDRAFDLLLNSSSVAAKARLLSVSSHHVASWLSVVLSESLGLPPVFQVAIKWWLGLDVHFALVVLLDHHGHHAITCKW